MLSYKSCPKLKHLLADGIYEGLLDGPEEGENGAIDWNDWLRRDILDVRPPGEFPPKEGQYITPHLGNHYPSLVAETLITQYRDLEFDPDDRSKLGSYTGIP